MIELFLRKQRGELWQGFLVLLQRVLTESESLACEVGLGVIGMLREEDLILRDGDRIQLPVVSAVRDEVGLQGGILFRLLGGAHAHREHRGGNGENVKKGG